MSIDENIVFPHFIVDRPEGTDLFEGQSQNRIAENITQFLIENDGINRKVIGVEGEWGSGKSNVIEILKNKLKDKYYFFIFDAWGHQEDLTRRSILEELLVKLIKDEVLKSAKTDWNNKLKTLLSRMVETEHKSIPKLSWAVLLSVVGVIFIPITKFLAEIYLKSHTVSSTVTSPASDPSFLNYIVAVLILIISFIPLIILIVFKIYTAKDNEKKKVFEELFYIYKGQEIINKSEETISENEPTVQQFTKFLSELENGSNKKLVIVFDNMDRLPSSKVKEIWSSIHTFFANDNNDLKTWAIVPFDNEHICNIFIEDNHTKNKHRADSYIHKTFSIVFHVAPPILSDWKSFFNSKFKDAFGYSPPVEQQLETIFDYHYLSDPKIKPRDIIYFINDLVALKKLWMDLIPFKYLSLFALKRMEIMKNPFNEIVSRQYLDSLMTLFEFDEQLETYISALAFNVPIEKADEILLKRPIENALKGEGDLLKASSHPSFFTVFESVFYNSNPDVDHTILCLDALPQEIQTSYGMTKYWEKLSSKILKISQFELKDVDSIMKISQRLDNKTIIEQLLKFLFRKAVKTFGTNNKPLYYGSKYYDLIIEIEILLQNIWPGKLVEDLLSESVVDAEDYFEFIKVCPNDYGKYKVKSDVKSINNFLISKFNTNEISPYFPLIHKIKVKIDLSEFKNTIIGIVPTILPTTANFDVTLTNIIDVGKFLSINGKTPFIITDTPAITLLTANPTYNRSLDLLLFIIKSNISNPKPDHCTNPNCAAMFANLALQQQFIRNYTYYFNYDDLILYALQFPSPLIKNVINELTVGGNVVAGSNFELLLSKYNEIKEKLFDNKIELCNSFVLKSNSFYNTAINLLSTGNLAYVNQIINDNYSINIKFMDNLISQANNFINSLEKEQWIICFSKSETSNEFELFKTLLLINKFENSKLSQPAFLAYAEIIKSMAKKEIAIPINLELWNNIWNLLKVNFNNNSSYKDVRDELLNYNHPEVLIDELLFFENGLFKFGKLDEDQKIADDVLRRILIPVASSDSNYTDILKRNAKNIKKIIEKANDSIIEFRTILDSKSQIIFDDPDIKEFSGILIEKSDNLIKESQSENNSESELLPGT